jgi:hypothetical protein
MTVKEVLEYNGLNTNADRFEKALNKAVHSYIEMIKNRIYEDYFCIPLERILLKEGLLDKDYDNNTNTIQCLNDLNNSLNSMSTTTLEKILDEYKYETMYDVLETLEDEETIDDWIKEWLS